MKNANDVSKQIETQIASYTDWRGRLLGQLRKLINETDPTLTEEWKWGVPVWTKNGMVCAISAFKDHVKINFFKGVKLKDPHKLLNAGFESKQHRAIDFSEGDKLNESEIKNLVREAVSLNVK